MGRRRAAAEILKRSLDSEDDSLTAWRKDPVLWARERLGLVLWERQCDILHSVARNTYTIVPACFGSGKSFAAAVIVCWWVDCWARDGNALVVTTAPSTHQVKTILWREIHRHYERARARGNPLPGRLLTQAWVVGGDGRGAGGLTVAFGRAPRDFDPTSLQGYHADHLLAIIDEAPGVDPLIWETIESLMTSQHVRLVALGNPLDPSGPFFDQCRNDRDRQVVGISAFGSPNLASVEWTPPPMERADYQKWRDDLLAALEAEVARPIAVNGLVTARWVLEKFKRWGPLHPEFESRVLGRFPERRADAVVPWAWIQSGRRRWTETGEGRETTEAATLSRGVTRNVILAIDPARKGDNETVIGSLTDGRRVELEDARAGLTAPEIVNRVRFLAGGKYEGRVQYIVVDEPGMGGPLIDFLRMSPGLPPVLPVNTGIRARNPRRYFNLRAELWFALRERLDPEQGHDLLELPPDDEMAAQMAAVTYRINPRGQTEVETKDELRHRGVADLGRADVVMLLIADPRGMRDFDGGEESGIIGGSIYGR